MTVADRCLHLLVVRLETDALLVGQEYHGTIVQETSTQMRLTLRGQRMDIAERMIKGTKTLQMQEKDFVESLTTKMTDSMPSQRATLNERVGLSARLCTTGIKTLTTHAIERTTACIKECVLLVAASRTYLNIRYVIPELITGRESLFVAKEILAVCEDKQSVAYINLGTQPTINQVETHDSIDIATSNRATMNGGLTTRQGQLSQGHRR